MTTIGLSYSLVKISTKCAPALGSSLREAQKKADARTSANKKCLQQRIHRVRPEDLRLGSLECVINFQRA